MDDLSLLYYSISLIFFIKTLFEFLGIKVSKKIIISVIPMVLFIQPEVLMKAYYFVGSVVGIVKICYV
jgi:hypothetical protein